ncbi:MAG: phosphoribosylanthranilate isomerase [Acidimicrobiia bacterium]|nr:phosphoribosylanthranilate isomerase [Acidimicrobiia bacterium]
MTWVKVCGLTNHEDVAVAVEAGADAIGLVNIETSPRYVSLAKAAGLAQGVPVHTVLLTIDAEPEHTLEFLEESGIDGVQPYGQRASEMARAATAGGYLVLNPQRAAPDLDLALTPGIPLLDTPSDTALGGTGRVFDWQLAESLTGRFVLAGGLGPDNVAAALAAVAPWGVDASSRLERVPGHKDRGMVADFVEKAKQT